MKVAISSSSFATALRRGELTHLEWLAECASQLGIDGVVFAAADFPRLDSEYVAQVRKVAVDLSLVPVALDLPGLLDPDRPVTDGPEALVLASALGAGLLRVTAGPPGDLPPETFSRTVATGKALAKLAKTANVTLTVSPAAGTLFTTVADVQNFCKYVDSAWLRYDLPANSPDRAALGTRDRVLIERLGLDEALGDVISRRPWIVLEGDGGDEPFERIGASVSALHVAWAQTLV